MSANGETSTLNVPGDLRGKWINATATRVYFLFAKPSPEYLAGGEATTSEFGNAVLAQ